MPSIIHEHPLHDIVAMNLNFWTNGQADCGFSHFQNKYENQFLEVSKILESQKKHALPSFGKHFVKMHKNSEFRLANLISKTSFFPFFNKNLAPIVLGLRKQASWISGNYRNSAEKRSTMGPQSCCRVGSITWSLLHNRRSRLSFLPEFWRSKEISFFNFYGWKSRKHLNYERNFFRKINFHNSDPDLNSWKHSQLFKVLLNSRNPGKLRRIMKSNLLRITRTFGHERSFNSIEVCMGILQVLGKDFKSRIAGLVCTIRLMLWENLPSPDMWPHAFF